MNKEKLALSGVEKIVPALRFPEFEGDGGWEEKLLGEISEITTGISNRQDSTKEEGKYTFFDRSQDIRTSNRFLFDGEAIIVAGEGQEFKPKYFVGKFDLHQRAYAVLNFKNNCIGKFLYYLIHKNRSYFLRYAVGSTVKSLRLPIFEKMLILIPSNPKEQQKIANCLSSLDNLITAETEKLDHLKDHKKGLLQMLFPVNGDALSGAEVRTKPQYRFKEFKNDGDWIETILENCLDYFQPTPYLVSSTNYDDKFKTPVLTAGKTFILGYTNEQEGIFNENLPVIIFDDFTTATKFVDFPFKAKSSAMKILLSKGGNNIKFLFEIIQNLKFEVGTHKRHWISIYSKLDILIPKDPKEQKIIADCFSSVDDLIASQTIKIKALKDHKKGLMQRLFPNVNEL